MRPIFLVIFVSLIAGTLKAATPSPVAAGKADLVMGQVVFAKFCARCHGVGGGGNGPDEAKLAIAPTNFLKVRLKFGDSLATITESIKIGRSDLVMPGFGGALTPAELANVAAYVKSLLPAKYEF